MPDPVVTAGLEAVFSFGLGNLDVAKNVMHFGYEGEFTPTHAVTLADNFSFAWYNTLVTRVSASVQLISVEVKDMTVTPWASYLHVLETPGTNTSNVLPYQLSAVLSWHTAHAGRRGRGRTYLAGFTEDHNTSSGTIDETLRNDVVSFGDALWLVDDGDGNSVSPAVWSRLDNELYEVTSFTCDNRWDVQRRRANRRLYS